MVIAAIAAIAATQPACGAWRGQYEEREWHALVAVPAQQLARVEATNLPAGSIWAAVDGTAYPGAAAGAGVTIASPIERAPLQPDQLGVVVREMWFRSMSEAGNYHGISVPVRLRLGDRVESRSLLIQVDADQPCRTGGRAEHIKVQQCSGTYCAAYDGEYVSADRDGMYPVGDLQIAVAVVCARKQTD
jgi:hypothetical protein